MNRQLDQAIRGTGTASCLSRHWRLMVPRSSNANGVSWDQNHCRYQRPAIRGRSSVCFRGLHVASRPDAAPRGEERFGVGSPGCRVPVSEASDKRCVLPECQVHDTWE